VNTLTDFFVRNYSHHNLGLLIVRLGVGSSMLIFHGYGKITGGPGTWEIVGSNMANLGIGFAPVFWGFMAALAESVGSLCLILGIFIRPACLLLAATMGVAMSRHLGLPVDDPRAGFQGASHAMELLAVYLGLLAAGPGRFAIGKNRPAS
jgi:putative oxidoreductase